MEINQRAPVVARHSVLIATPRERVWAELTDIGSWPSWRHDVSRAELDGQLGVGAVFRWRSRGTNIISTIGELDTGRRIGWTGSSLGTRVVHTWTLTPGDGDTLVETEESMEGWLVRPLKGWMQRMLDGSLDAWLAALRERSEGDA